MSTGRPRRVRLFVVLLLAAIAASTLVWGAFGTGADSDAQLAQRELVELSAIRLQAMRVTELAHLDLFRVAGDDVVDPSRLQGVLDTWQVDMAEVARRVPIAPASPLTRVAAEQLRDVISVEVVPIAAGDPVLSARTQLLPAQNRLVEGAGQDGLAGVDASADRAAEHLYVLGIATDVAVAAAANRPDSSSAWTSFGIAIRTLGGAGGLGVLTAGPLSGWVAGPGAAERLTELIDPLVEELGSRAPSPDYLGTVAWSLDQLDLVRGAEPPVAAPSTEAGLAGLLGGIDPGLITSVLGALAPADGVGPPLAVDEALDETERLVGEITRLGASQSSDRSRALHDSAAESRNTATLLLLMAAAVVGAAVILLLLLVVAARRAQRRSEQDSLEDVLTGMLNRGGLFSSLVDLRADDGMWVVLVDLDRFKPVNDSYGHAVGDLLLVAVAGELESAAAPLEGLVARLGGDEFAIVLGGATAHDVDLAVARIIERLEVVTVDGRRIELGCSVGVVHGAPGVGIDQLLTEADLAMFRAKRSGRGRSVHFDEATRAALASFRDGTIGDTIDIGVRLQRSLVDRSIVGAMVVPQVPVGGGDPIEGSELRLIAEFAGRRFGLLDATLAGIGRSGRTIPPAGIRLWFEVSAVDVVTYGGVEALWERLTTVGLSGAPFGVELVDAGTQDPDALAAAVSTLQELGVHVAVWSTGPGAVALTGLVRLGADRLVVDPSVVEAIRGGDVELSRAVGSVTGLGAALGSEVIATGVPSLDVAHTLVELGVGVAQVMVTEPWAPKRPLKRGDSVVVDR